MEGQGGGTRGAQSRAVGGRGGAGPDGSQSTRIGARGPKMGSAGSSEVAISINLDSGDRGRTDPEKFMEVSAWQTSSQITQMFGVVYFWFFIAYVDMKFDILCRHDV